MNSSLTLLYIITPILVLFLGVGLWYFLYEKFFLRQLNLCIEDNLYIRTFKRKFSTWLICWFSYLIERQASRKDVSLPVKLGIDQYWVKKLKKNPTKKNIKRVLRFCIENGLYAAFIAILKKPKLSIFFSNSIQEQKIEAVFNALAKDAFLDPFDGRGAKEFFKNELEVISELSQISSSEDRWFYFRILAFVSDDEKFGDLKWEAFTDHHFEIRKMMIETVQFQDRVKYYNHLYDRLLNDPQQEIRKRVKSIIIEQYSDLYNPSFLEMNIWQKNHFAENFSETIEIDKKIAFDLILEKNIELRQQAVDFLNNTDALKKLFLSIDINDVSKLDYAKRLLMSALEVHSEKFLEAIALTRNAGTLLCAALLLKEKGSRMRIRDLAKQVFSLRKDGLLEPLLSELYLATLDCINIRGEEGAFLELRNEIMENRSDESLVALLLDKIPERAEIIFTPIFLAFIKDPSFVPRKNLIEAVLRVSKENISSELIRIIKSDQTTPWEVKINAIEYFKKENIELCFQFILENLEFFPSEEIGFVFKTLYTYSEKLFSETIKAVLSEEDSRTSVLILENLYEVGKLKFIDFLRKALESSDSTIRKAGINGLFCYHQPEFFEEILPFLSDSDKEVRLLAAKKLASAAEKSEIKIIESILMDENELNIVKKALISGLSESENKETVDLLIKVGAQFGGYFDLILSALKEKNLHEIAPQLVNLYNQTNEIGQKIIYTHFRNEGVLKEEQLLDLLKKSKEKQIIENIHEILHKSSFVEKTINGLKNKNVDIRLSALKKLILIDTNLAHKGILLAGRDNNKEIRSKAMKKIEELNKNNKKAIELLKEDSSKAVQMNILWILNKIAKMEGKNASRVS